MRNATSMNIADNDTFSKIQGFAWPSPNSFCGLLTRWTCGSKKISTARGGYLTGRHCKRHYVCLHIVLPRTLVRHERHTMNHPNSLHRPPQTLLPGYKQMIALSRSEAAWQQLPSRLQQLQRGVIPSCWLSLPPTLFYQHARVLPMTHFQPGGRSISPAHFSAAVCTLNNQQSGCVGWEQRPEGHHVIKWAGFISVVKRIGRRRNNYFQSNDILNTPCKGFDWGGG